MSNFKSAAGRIEIVLQNLPWLAGTTVIPVLDQARNLEAIRKEEHNDRTIRIVQELPAPTVLLVYVRSRQG